MKFETEKGGSALLSWPLRIPILAFLPVFLWLTTCGDRASGGVSDLQSYYPVRGTFTHIGLMLEARFVPAGR